MDFMIIKVLLTITCFAFITSEPEKQNVTRPARLNDTVVTEGGGPVVINKTIEADPSHTHMIKVNPSKQNKTKSPEFEVPEKNDGKQSVARKGVTLSTNVTSTTPKPKKPTMTEAEEDSVYVPPAKLNSTANNHGNSIDSFIESGKKTDYIVPIVVVILSVPLVAIISSVLYKRGAEWWQHRHYRRMDFLIEGMYNN